MKNRKKLSYRTKRIFMHALCSIFGHEIVWGKPPDTGETIGICFTCDTQFYKADDGFYSVRFYKESIGRRKAHTPA